jgi:large subunit ribosomal protein L5
VINMGLGEATQNTKLLDPLVADLAHIAGQKPVTTKAKKSIAAFKVRAGMSIGAMVTLRNDKAYEFLDRLISTRCRACATSAACRRRVLTGAAITRSACATS